MSTVSTGTASTVSDVFAAGDQYLEDLARFDPLKSYIVGASGLPAALADYSPAGEEARADLARRALGSLGRLSVKTDADRRAAGVMVEHLSAIVERYDNGDYLRSVSMRFTPAQEIHDGIDGLTFGTADEADTVASCVEHVPSALLGYRDSLQQGLLAASVASQRQALVAADMADSWGAGDGEGTFDKLADEAGRLFGGPLERRMRSAADSANAAYRDFAAFLRTRYLPHAEPADPIGPERYDRAVRLFLGGRLDLHDAYESAWDGLLAVEQELRQEAAKIAPGEPVGGVFDALDHDPAWGVDSAATFRTWMQEIVDGALDELDGSAFDVPPEAHRVEVVVAPPGGPLMANYSEPSQDFSRPGRIDFAPGGQTWFPLWSEKTIAYHEGMPGHHMQTAMAYTAPPEQTSRFQRLLGFTSGHGEGWAVYAEQLMDELGYHHEPQYRLGLLRSAHLRLTMTLLDIGLHLQLPAPAGAPSAGRPWTAEAATELFRDRTLLPPPLASQFVDRLLGVAGQGLCYEMGCRRWLDVRARVQAREGADFSLKRFHNTALGIGFMGLDAFERDPVFN